MRIALGLSYNGQGYEGWQSQLSRKTIQDKLESSLSELAQQPIQVLCAGRTDAGVHGLMQVVHFDTQVQREMSSWVRGTNAFLPFDIAVQWAKNVPDTFHARGSAIARRYAYILLESPVRPSIESSRVGWVFRTLNHEAMNQAAQYLLDKHDFTSFRASACQALSPIKNIHRIDIRKHTTQSNSAYWRFDFEANAFLHHMIRNIMGCLLQVGQSFQTPQWMNEVLQAKNRNLAAPTFPPDGLYFLGPVYDTNWGLPEQTSAFDWLIT